MNFIIDGLNIAFRAHHIYDVKQGLTSSEGIPTGLIYGFLLILSKWRKKYPHHQMIVVWDRPGGKDWRQEIVPEYKANRPKSVVPSSDQEFEDTVEDPFAMQLHLLRGILPHLGVDQFSAPKREADDMIGYLTRKVYPEEVNFILTSDRDMLQLVTSKTVVLTPDNKVYDRAKVEAEYGVPPEKLVQLRALFGDTSDNLPGISRFRKKVAARLVNKYGGVDSIYRQPIEDLDLTVKESEKLTAFQEQAQKNLRVMNMRMDAESFDRTSSSFNEHEINTICATLEFKKIRNRLLEFNRPKQGFLKCLISSPSTQVN